MNNERVGSASLNSTGGGQSEEVISAISGQDSNSIDSSSGISVLHPILSRDARTRSYLVGSIGCKDSLLGSDELNRYFPDGKLSILACTWNMSSLPPPEDINDLLLPESVIFVPDLFAIGIQESPGGSNQDMRNWEIKMQTTIGPSHVLLHSCSLGVLHLAIFVRRDLIWFCSVPEDSAFNSRPAAANQIKTKGAIGISLCFFGTSFLFINSHLPAHESKLKERIDEYDKITTSMDLPKNLRPLKPRYVSKDVTGRYDCVFWFGDLNFRVERPFKEVIKLIKEIRHQASPSMECLLLHDQLTKVLDLGTAFYGFNEGLIRFPPSYKYAIGTNKYDDISPRVPSYTDRILYRSKRPGHINCVYYDSVTQIKTSDHKPVYALLEAQLRPGRDNTQLNAGSFNRDVYIEALKRRASEGEHANERRGSLICNLS